MNSSGSLVNRHSHITIILLSVIVGAMLAALVIYYPKVHTAAEAQTQVTGAGTGIIKELDRAFTSVADRTTPAVVSISVETVGGTPEVTGDDDEQGQGSDPGDLFNNPFFGPFFKDFRDKSGKGAQPKVQPRGHSLGSGWIYRDDGYIVTNSHVIRNADKITVRLHDVDGDETEYPAKLVGSDPKTELAVIKVDAKRKLPPLKLGSSKDTKVGQWVMAVGAPFELEQTVTVGVISAKGRFLPGQSKYIRIGDIIQTDASINPGNSGGPLVNMDGDVIGINVAIVSSGLTPGNVGIGFAIPSDTARYVVDELIQNKKVARGWLGITIGDLDDNMKDFYGTPSGGALVEGVNKDGPAVNSDLKVDDVIVAVDGEKTKDTWDLQKAVSVRRPGTEVTLGVIRDKKPVDVKIKLGEMPAKYAGLEDDKKQPTASQSSPLGIKVEDLTPEIAQQLGLERKAGVVVRSVVTDGPSADRIESGDIITRVNRTVVNSVAEYNKAIDEARAAKATYVVVGYERQVDGDMVSGRVSITPRW
jgi:serine protease Do